jgi:hypothetical protein
MPLTAPRPRTLHRAEHIGSTLKGGVNVCQRQLVKEVLGPLVTEFVRNFGREGECYEVVSRTFDQFLEDEQVTR